MKRALTLEEHVAAGMAKAVEVGDCLEWQGYMANHGTQPAIKMRLEGRRHTSNIPVPRLIWEAANGPLGPGRVVYRKCCNNSCVLLEHIAVGTRADWAKARKRAGVTKHKTATVIAITLSARRRPATLNSPELAAEVRQLRAAGVKRSAIAELTGVSPAMVAEISCGSAWRDISSPFAGLMR